MSFLKLFFILFVVVVILAIVIFFYAFIGGYWSTIWSHQSISERVRAYFPIDDQMVTSIGVSKIFTFPETTKRIRVFFPDVNFGLREVINNYFTKDNLPYIQSELYYNDGTNEVKILETDPGQGIASVVFSSDKSKIYLVIRKDFYYITGFDAAGWRSGDGDIYSLDLSSKKLSILTNLHALHLKIVSVSKTPKGDSVLYSSTEGEVEIIVPNL